MLEERLEVIESVFAINPQTRNANVTASDFVQHRTVIVDGEKYLLVDSHHEDVDASLANFAVAPFFSYMYRRVEEENWPGEIAEHNDGIMKQYPHQGKRWSNGDYKLTRFHVFKATGKLPDRGTKWTPRHIDQFINTPAYENTIEVFNDFDRETVMVYYVAKPRNRVKERFQPIRDEYFELTGTEFIPTPRILLGVVDMMVNSMEFRTLDTFVAEAIELAGGISGYPSEEYEKEFSAEAYAMAYKALTGGFETACGIMKWGGGTRVEFNFGQAITQVENAKVDRSIHYAQNTNTRLDDAAVIEILGNDPEAIKKTEDLEFEMALSGIIHDVMKLSFNHNISFEGIKTMINDDPTTDVLSFGKPSIIKAIDLMIERFGDRVADMKMVHSTSTASMAEYWGIGDWAKNATANAPEAAQEDEEVIRRIKEDAQYFHDSGTKLVKEAIEITPASKSPETISETPDAPPERQKGTPDTTPGGSVDSGESGSYTQSE